MIKTHKETRTETIDIVDDYVCNKCGSSCRTSPYHFDGLIEAKVCGSYASKLGDGSIYVFSLCESCLEELFASFKIEPGSTSPWDPFE